MKCYDKICMTEQAANLVFQSDNLLIYIPQPICTYEIGKFLHGRILGKRSSLPDWG